jgi:hypothetical protein
MNRKSIIFQIYLYLLCFTSLIALVISAVIGIYSIVRISVPEFTMKSYDWKKLESFEIYKWNYKSEKIGDEELKKIYQKEKELAVKIERREAGRALIRGLLILAISLTIFLFHWRIAIKESKET